MIRERRSEFANIYLSTSLKPQEMQGWSTLLNGELLRAAEDAGFEVFLTPDKNLIYRQNLSHRKIAIVVLGQNRWKLIQPRLDEIAKVTNDAKPGT